jgi:hypothetical protein
LNKLDYWKLCADFTVVQAALIVCGISPEEMQWQVERTTESRCPDGYIAIRTALRHALISGKIQPVKTVFQYTDDGEETNSLDLNSTTVAAAEIDKFLKRAGVICDFFDEIGGSDSLGEPAMQQMPPKLAAALKAWSAVSGDPVRLRGRSPKQALDQWLVENAGQLGLLNRDGQPNRTGIEEICKVANWKPEGGATPTPTGAVERRAGVAVTPKPMMRLPVARLSFAADLDDEIPF